MSKSSPSPTIDSLAPEKRCYACNSPDVPKRVKIDGFTEPVCLADYARHQRGEVLLPFGCEPATIEAHPLSAEQVERDLAALKAGSEAAMAKAARNSNPAEVTAFEEAEKQHAGRGRVKVARVPIAPKPAPAPIAAPIQAAPVVAVESKPEPVREPVVAPIRYPGLPPQCQPRPFVLRPAEEMRPGLCRRAECKRPPVHRDLCDPCYTVACGRKILEEVAGPCRPNIGSRSRDPANSLLSMLERAVIEKPGVHITELVEPLGRTREVICKAVCNLRKLGRLKRSPVPRNHPDYMLLYPPAEIKVVATRNRKPKSADLSTTKA